MRSDLGGFLVDTNVLVSAHDPRDQVKQQQAVAVPDRLIEAHQAVLSVQCLSEFFNAVTQRLPEAVAPADALMLVENFAQSCRVFDLTPAAVAEGCRGVVRHQLSLWDALIWAVAKLNQIPYVLTEDAEHGRFLEGVRFLDPFNPVFALPR